MPNCKNCGSRISKFEKDMCPVCGTVNPLKNVTSDTVEITSEISLSNENLNFKPKERIVTFFLFFFLGIFGVPLFYLNEIKKGFIWSIINITLIVGLGFLFSLPLKFGYLLGFLIPVIIFYVINSCIGAYYLIKSDIKDGNGDFLK